MTDSPSPELVANMKSGDSPPSAERLDNETPERAWLIERGQAERQRPTMWWRGTMVNRGDMWTENASEARRFCTKEDAQRVIDDKTFFLGNDAFGRATEHIFFRAASPSIQSSPPELRKLLEDLIAGAISHDRLGANAQSWFECDGCLKRQAAVESLFARLETQRSDWADLATHFRLEKERAEAAFSSLKEDALTPWEAQEILGGGPESGRPGYLRHHPDCNPPKDCMCNLFGIQNRLRRLSQSRVTK